MKLIKVKCPKNKKIEVEDFGTGAARCPAHCPLKKQSRCFNNTFRYTSVLNASVVPDVPYAVGAGSDASQAEKRPPISTSQPQNIPSRNAARGVLPEPQPPFSTRAREGARVAPAYDAKKDLSPQLPNQPSVIGYDDPFSEPASQPSVIGYADPFATEAPPVRRAATEKKTTSKSTLDKYNDSLVQTNSIFSVVKSRNPDEPCFTDGAYMFYERAVSGKQTSGNSRAAIRHIFQHWYVSRVFKEDGKAYQEPFLYLLKLQNFKEKEDALKAIVEDVSLDVNRKFFRLFYTVIYKNQISAFYWSNCDSPLMRVSPRFLDVNDFYKKMVASNNPSEFLTSFEPCFDELIYFLQSGVQTENGREWFKKHIPLALAERQQSVSFVDETEGHLSLVNLGEIRSFSESLKKPDVLHKMLDRYRFLREFKITVNRKILPREKALPLLTAKTTEDDSIYETVGLSKLISSQCATAYNYYTTLLKEYVDTFHPETLLIGDSYFTCRNFYQELVDSITSACAHLSEADNQAETYSEIKRLHLIKSFFSRGVFEYFESRCETDRLPKLKKVFVDSPKIDLEAYFRFDGVKHWVYENGQRKSISGYLADAVTDRVGQEILGRVGSDKVIKAYFAARIEPADWKIAENDLSRLIAEQQKLLDEM